MAEITAEAVRALRERTSLPMMECKKALAEAQGNMARAEEILRVKLGNKAAKASTRVAAEGIVAHMNRDHTDAVLTLARAHADATAEEATMLSVDRLGFRVRLRSGERLHGARIAFPHEVTTPEQCRATLIEMIRNARR